METQTDFVEFDRSELERSIVARFEQQAAGHGDRMAVDGARGAFTYKELNAFANRIAGAILDRYSDALRGPVAVLLAQDGASVPGMLGVLKAGGFFVPLDPTHPIQRNVSVLRESDARLLLTDRDNLELARTLTVEAGISNLLQVEETTSYSDANLKVIILPHDRCCLFYTSGSTGRPKGVSHLHRNILHGTMNYTNVARLCAGDRMSLLSSPGTIASSTGMFGALLNGASLYPFDVRRAGAKALGEWLDNKLITCLHAVPTLFRHLSRFLDEDRQFEHLRFVRLGGEAVTQTEWRLFRAHFPPHAALQVALSSTETLDYRQALYTRDSDPVDPVLSVGDPLPDQEMWLVDRCDTPPPKGEIGEIMVRSEFVFEGYWRRSRLTAQTLSEPDEGDGRQTFRTGDLGRFGPKGAFYHVGRTDLQVKIAGNRVDVGEVEQALRMVRSIADAAVTTQPAAGGLRLVAFVESSTGEMPSSLALRTHLRSTLPEHMVPSTFTLLEKLPLLPGGKIDRLSLTQRPNETTGASRDHMEPRDPIEETLVEVWQGALHRTRISVHDDLFLDLDGDSLSAAQIASAVADLFGRELSLDVFYEARTVARLGIMLREGNVGASTTSTPLAMNPQGERVPLFALCGAFGYALRLLLLGHALGPEQPFYGLQPPGMDWESVNCLTLEEMAGHYVGEIRKIQPHGPYKLLGTSFGGILAFEIAQQIQNSGDSVAFLAMVDTEPPTCLFTGKVSRATRDDWVAGVDTSDLLIAKGVRVALAHRAALDRYHLRSLFKGRITYFKCLEPTMPEESDRRPLWIDFATEGIRVLEIPGRHGTFHREPQFSVLVLMLRNCLKEEAGR